MKNLEYVFSKRTSFVDALATCDKIVNDGVIKKEYDLKSENRGLVCYFQVPDYVSDDSLIQLGSIFALGESNQRSRIRKFNEMIRNES